MTAQTRAAWRRSPLNVSEAMLLAVGAACVAVLVLATGADVFYAFAAVAGFAAFVRYPVLGLHVTTALLLLSGSATLIGDLRLSVPLTASKVAGAAAFAAWIVNALVTGRPLRVIPVVWVLIVFTLWAGLGVLMSPNFRMLWPEWVRLVTLAAYFFFAVNVLDTEARVRTFVTVVLVCGMFMAAFAIAQYFFTDLQFELSSQLADMGAGAEGAFIETDTDGNTIVRVSGLAGHSNWLAMVILVIMPLNVYWFMTARGPLVKALALFAVAAEIIALILTFTRTGFLVGIVTLAILGLRHLVRFTPQRVTAVALAVFVAWFMLPGAYKSRVLDFGGYARSDSVANRYELQQAAWDIWTGSPIYGVGLGGYGPAMLDENTRVARTMRWFVKEHNWPPQFLGTHNMYLQLMAETGIVGLGLILLFFAMLLRDLRRAQAGFAEAGDRHGMALTSTLEVGLIAFLVSAFFLHALQQKI
jgi:putative inorganic carbon (hco3(-)) transporter